MTDTGERYVSGTHGTIQHEHYHRYLFALDFCRGQDVLDIASGEGYGTHLIGQVARSVVGVDLDPSAVDFANEHYASEHVAYRQGDAAKLPLADRSVDVVVSFETLEHFTAQEEFVAEVGRVLRPNGVLVISSPNRVIYTEQADYHNPFHTRELDRRELEELLAREFPYVQIFEQRALWGSVILGADVVGRRGVGGFETKDGQLFDQFSGVPNAPYLVAVASKLPRPASSHSVMQSPSHLNSILEGRERRIADLTRECAHLTGEYARLTGECARLGALLEGRQRECLAQNAEISRLASATRDLETRIGDMIRSSSWRITAPLRDLMIRWRQLRSPRMLKPHLGIE